jgi:hypothetical protein
VHHNQPASLQAWLADHLWRQAIHHRWLDFPETGQQLEQRAQILLGHSFLGRIKMLHSHCLCQIITQGIDCGIHTRREVMVFRQCEQMSTQKALAEKGVVTTNDK